MDPVLAIFAALGGPAAVGRIIGKPVEHTTLMRRRRSIPVAYWQALIEHAEAERIDGVTYASLVAAHVPAPVALRQATGAAA